MAPLVLEGSSLGERQKYLNKLVAQARESELSLEAVQGLAEQPQLRQLYIARLAQRFYKPEVVCELFKSENSMIVATALKCTQFFKGEDAAHANPDYLIQNIFPCAAYKTRCKMLSLFSLYLKDEKLAEEFYVKILKQYKLSSAVLFLPLCSLAFMQATVLQDGLILPCRELMKIYKRDKNLIIEYLKRYYSHGFGQESLSLSKRYVSIDYVEFWPIFAQDFPDVFLDFFNDVRTKISPTFGYRTSLVLCKSDPQKIVDNINDYICFLNHQAIIDSFKGEKFDKIIFNLTKYADKDHFYNNYNATKLLGHMKPEYRIIYWMKLYAEKYDGASLLDNQNVNPEEFKYLPKNLRTTWAQKKLKNYSKAKDDFDEGYYLKCLTPDIAMPRFYFLKDNTTVTDARLDILRHMIACCKINNDTDCLLQVMKNVAKKHRNDLEMLRYGFLNELMTVFKLHQLSAEHWNVIDEMLEIMYYNKDIEVNYRQAFIVEILQESLHFRILNKLPYDAIIDKLLAFEIRSLNMITDIPEYHRAILNAFYTKMEVVIRQDLKSHTAENYLYLILLSIKTWNEKNKSQQRLVVQEKWLMELLRLWVAAADSDKRSNVFSMLDFQVEIRNEFVNEVFKFNFNQEKAYNYLKHNDRVLLDNIDLLLRDSLPMYRSQYIGYVRFYQKIRAYCVDSLGRAIIDKLHEKVKEKRGIEQSGSLVQLSWLLDLKTYEQFITPFIPAETKIDITNKDADEYQRTEVITKNIKFINPPISFEMISKIARDDYLKFALPSLLSLPFKKASQPGISFIQTLLSSPVSVKKHGVRLAYFLYPDSLLLPTYSRLWQAEPNSSIRQVVFNKLMHSFQNEHDPVVQKQYFDLILDCLKTFEEKDQGSFQFLKSISPIPPQFVNEFCTASWRAMKRLSASNVDVDSAMIGFTSTLWQFVDLLGEEFCQEMVNEFLYVYSTDDSPVSTNLLAFIIHYLVNLKSAELQEAHIQKTCQAFGKFVTDCWDLKPESNFPYRQTVKYFIEESCNQCINFHSAKNLINFLQALSEMMRKALPLEAAFELNLKLLLSKSYLGLKRDFDKTPDDPLDFLENYGKMMSSSLDEYISRYGILINTYFRTVAADFTVDVVLYLCDDSGPSLLRIVGGVLDQSKRNESLLLAISLLNRIKATNKTRGTPQLKAILKIIIENGDLAVKMILNEGTHLSAIELFGQTN